VPRVDAESDGEMEGDAEKNEVTDALAEAEGRDAEGVKESAAEALAHDEVGDEVPPAEKEAVDVFVAAAVIVCVGVLGGGMVRVTVPETVAEDCNEGVLSGVPLTVGLRVALHRAEAVKPLAEAVRVAQLPVALTVELCDWERREEPVGLTKGERDTLALTESDLEPDGDTVSRVERVAVSAPVVEEDCDGERLRVGDVVKVRVAEDDTVSEREPV
jgi:hypothetical protein